MKFSCDPVDVDFISRAPQRVVTTIDIRATPERVFAELAGDRWPEWFPGMKGVEWTSPKPYGVGTTRTVTLETLVADERFILWEDHRRFAFVFVSTSVPAFKSFAEDYVLEPTAGGCRFTWRVGWAPRWFVSPIAGRVNAQLTTQFQDVVASLEAYIESHPE